MSHSPTGDWTVADYLIASKRCEIHGLEQLVRTGQLVVSISNLVHALQRERGASNMYIASGGHRFASELTELVADANRQERAFRDALGHIDPGTASLPGASRLFNRIAFALHGLDELPGVRLAIESLNVDADTVIDGYSALIQGLLAVVFEAADSAADPDISRVLVAMFHLMQGKEFAGQERAAGAAGFASGSFGPRLSDRLRHLIESQERCFQIFLEFADSDSLDVWQASGAGTTSADMERLRRIACTASADSIADAALADTWFDVATQRIDAMKQVEDQLEASLESLCQRRIGDARADLDCHQDRIETLASQPGERPGFAIFFSESEAGQPDSAAGVAYHTDYASPQLGRSLIDLVQSQSQRLQTMSEELAEARSALAERKAVERAKGLIMRHRQMSEEEAYRFLRQVAMAQSRRLADVAEDTIAMQDILKGPKQ
ncbi:nitrate regulatory protein [Aquisalimonas asiatica]|uniref:Response regulator receiver and ANTAR domain protein n=1 Tax=Aquisalimonas asiatica TaxID=406100 RepID=A0A1H8THF7_9GAMM|nr:nitrate regulatory protein [Aquisalimonas asiatica]SEO90241.1 response regulator receiver and ANTAR domain protein [Aquisalimonas asiatica]